MKKTIFNAKRAVMTLIAILTTGMAQVWAAAITPPEGFTAVTQLSDLSDGDYVILVTNQVASRVGITGWDGTSDGTISSDASDWTLYRVDKSSTSFKLYDEAAGGYLWHDGTGNNMKYNGTGSSFTIEKDASTPGRLQQTDPADDNTWFLQKRNSYIRFYTSSNTYFYVCRATSPTPPDPVYVKCADIVIDAGTFTGSPISGTTSVSYNATHTFNSCGLAWYGFADDSSDDDLTLTMKRANGTDYSTPGYYYYYHDDSEGCGQVTNSFKLYYYVESAGSHAAYIQFYDAEYEKFAYVMVTINAPASCSAPTVTTGATSGATANSLTFNCAGGISTIGCTITEYGYAWGTSANPTISGSHYSLGNSYTVASTAFASHTPTNLACNTTYYMRPYATNSMGTSYGAQTSLSTSACPVDHFIDDMHSTAGYTGTGMAKEGDYSASIPTIADKTERADGNCAERHYHFVGWVTEANKADPTGHIETITGTATGTTYYAVWAQEDTH